MGLSDKMTILKNGVRITKSGFLVNVILFFIFFTSYFVFSFHIPQHVIPSVDKRLIVQASFNFIIAITVLLTSFFIHRLNKLRLIYASSAATSIVTVLLLFASNEFFRLTIIFVIGIFFGAGILAFLANFWDSTVAEERGRIAGLIGFVSLPFYFLVDIVAVALDFPEIVMIGIILSLGTLVIMLLRPKKAVVLMAKEYEIRNHSEKRTILLYAIPWIVFSLINATLAKNISLSISLQVSSSFYMLLALLQIIGVVFGAMCGGIIADFFGRRLSLALGLTLYGISSALAGLFTNAEILSFVYLTNGLSWGILLILYTFVIWSDLSNKENYVKMYSIGLVIYYLAFGFGVLPTQLSQISLIASALAC